MTPRVFVGTSGWSYAPWKGIFYPEDLPLTKMLRYYAEHFPTVEVNNTFYRVPTPEVVAGWAATVPPTFSFTLKAPQRITHRKQLRDEGAAMDAFVRAAAELGGRRGPLLFQLPPYAQKDVAALRVFLAVVSAAEAGRVAFEFRHASWFDAEVYDVLRAADCALCTADGEDVTAPFTATASWGYVRLRRPRYTRPALRAWADRVRAQAWSHAWIFLKHEDEARGPTFALRLMDALGDDAVRPR